MPQHDPFNDNATGLESPASNALAVTPSDTDDLPVKPRALMVNVAGDVVLTMNGDPVTLRLIEGAIYPFRASRIHATGTTATGITVFW